MFRQPLTYWVDLPADAAMRQMMMREFAANGAKHLILPPPMIHMIMADHKFSEVLRNEMADYGLTFADAHAPFRGILDMNCPVKCSIAYLRSRLVVFMHFPPCTGCCGLRIRNTQRHTRIIFMLSYPLARRKR